MSASARLVHRFCLLVAASTLFLIFAGGLVTSTDSGLAVPDWPLSYGRLMPAMTGGIFFEHGHRLIAGTVGVLTVLLALLVTWKEERGWIKKAAWAAVAAVLAQAVLGGLTVLFKLPKPISIAHACLAQTFFALTVALAVWTSRSWCEPAPARVESARTIPLHRLAIFLFAALYLQLILGAVVRHTGHGLVLHITQGIVASILTFWVSQRVLTDVSASRALRGVAGTLAGLVIFQMGLGLATYAIVGFHPAGFSEFAGAAAVTLHVVTGAAILGLALMAAILSYRSRPADVSPLRISLSDYFTLTKPGISFMAAVTALAGYVLGSRGHFSLAQLLHTCIGTMLAAAGAGALNMLIERDIDATMDRTKTRPLPSGRLKPGEVLFLGSLAAVAGVLYLSQMVNLLTAVLGALTLCIYLYVYTPLKKVSSICVAAGAVAGALPPVMGWTAATGRLGVEALILFAILYFWQFPHFLALAWLYRDDYARGGLHMLPEIDAADHLGGPDGKAAARSMTVHSVLLLMVSVLPTVMGLTGRIYLVTALLLGAGMTVASALFVAERSRARALRLFLASIAYIPLLVVLMVANKAAA